MALFLQFDIREEFGLPLLAGSHLSVFLCPLHNDAPHPYPPQMPDAFWANTDDPYRSEFKYLATPEKASYRLLLAQPSSDEIEHPPDGVVEPQRLLFKKRFETVRECQTLEKTQISARHVQGYLGLTSHDYNNYSGLDLFKVGGHPTWIDDCTAYQCCCGADMVLLCQIPYPSMVFGISERYNDTSAWNNLFLSNAVYIFACQDQCDPLAVLATVY